MLDTPKKLTNLQLELLKLFPFQLSETQLAEVKNLLTKYFADKASDDMDQLWEKNGWSNETMEQWLTEHKRIQ